MMIEIYIFIIGYLVQKKSKLNNYRIQYLYISFLR